MLLKDDVCLLVLFYIIVVHFIIPGYFTYDQLM
jgi:hypothetical protein